MKYAKQWKENAFAVMNQIEATQENQIKEVAKLFADTIESGHLVHTFGCGHANLPIEEMYPRIGGFVGFHPICELPLTFFTHIRGEMGIDQFLFLERCQDYADAIFKSWNFDKNDVMWIFSHTGINAVNIELALKAKEMGMKVVAFGSAKNCGDRKSGHTSGKTLFQVADYVVDNCTPLQDASVQIEQWADEKNGIHNYIGPLSTIAFITDVWMVMGETAEILENRGVKMYIHPSHNQPGDTTARERLAECVEKYREATQRC
ncbi:MAG: sugar isomerase domain-containing protein [Paludibacteraceae bacterium]|nr:sugar isomerase domain-containing protein [Paludibacteraceae bacterium]